MIFKNINDTEKFAKELTDKLLPGDIICLVGDLSAGKTTLSKYIIKAFGVNNEVVSPTFNYVKEYNIKNNKKFNRIYHFDVYRIKSTDELLEIGFMIMLMIKILSKLLNGLILSKMKYLKMLNGFILI